MNFFLILHREANANFDVEIRDDVIEECNKHGGVLHIFVDKASPQGNVYVKCPSIASAVNSVNALHGRWFAGRFSSVHCLYIDMNLNNMILFNSAILSSHVINRLNLCGTI